MIEACHFDRILVFLPFLDEVMGSLRLCTVVNSLYCREGYVWVVQDINGVIGSNYMHGSIWVIVFELYQEYDRLSYPWVVCDHDFVRFCTDSSVFCGRICVW